MLPFICSRIGQKPLLWLRSLLYHLHSPSSSPSPFSFTIPTMTFKVIITRGPLYIHELKIWLGSLNSSGLWILMLCYASCQSRKNSLSPIMCHVWTLENQACCCEKLLILCQRFQNGDFEKEPETRLSLGYDSSFPLYKPMILVLLLSAELLTPSKAQSLLKGTSEMAAHQ